MIFSLDSISDARSVHSIFLRLHGLARRAEFYLVSCLRFVHPPCGNQVRNPINYQQAAGDNAHHPDAERIE